MLDRTKLDFTFDDDGAFISDEYVENAVTFGFFFTLKTLLKSPIKGMEIG